MHSIHRTIGSFLLAAALLTPTIAMAAAGPQDAGVTVRVYDPGHKDYHNWDDREDKAYRQYLTDQHMKYHDYKHISKAQQRAYWNWRHDHPDHD